MKRRTRLTLIAAAVLMAPVLATMNDANAQNAQATPAPAASAAPAPAATTAPAQPQASDGAEATIKKAVDGVTSAINADKSVQSGDRARITQLVDAKIVPFVNAEAMTQRAVGPNWGKASAEQKAQLIQEFKMLLINTYSGAFTAYRPDTKIEYKPTRVSGDTAVVRSTVVGAARDPIPIDYYLEKQDNGWKVTDLAVYSARLVELYKSQFSAAIAQGGVDGLIRDLKAKNANGGGNPAPTAKS
jgi:phospholipid transport system substrate-binding protein